MGGSADGGMGRMIQQISINQGNAGAEDMDGTAFGKVSDMWGKQAPEPNENVVEGWGIST